MAIGIATLCVVLLNLYAVVLVVLRGTVYGLPIYRPMLVNVALSFAPVLAAILALAGLLLLPGLVADVSLPAWLPPVGLWAYIVIGTGLWLLFFPNSIYLITELNFSHRHPDDPVPLWFDIVQTLALTLSGIANAVLSLAVVQTEFLAVVVDPARTAAPSSSSWVFAGIVLVLGAIGVYLGRYLRFNSWDVRHPAGMVRKLGAHLRERGKALEAGGFVVTHAVLVALVYVPVYLLAYGVLLGG